MKRVVVFLWHSAVIITLTLLSQIGGVIYLLSLVLVRYIFHWSGRRQILLFIGLYTLATFLIVPVVAPVFGRVTLPLTGELRPLTFLTCVLNRHYVRPEMKGIIREKALAIAYQYPGTVTYYLDANFPFADGFPLIPHLSHSDGKKLDLAFYYQSVDTKQYMADSPSWLGYGGYEEPKLGEENWPQRCEEQGYWQYSVIQALAPSWSQGSYEVEAGRTRLLLDILAKTASVEKIFLEPHLVQRWKLSSLPKIRFHGCHAVRHDDHIHVQAH